MAVKTASSPVVIRVPDLTPRQQQMLAHPAKILHLGTGTKTGKSFALCCWLCQGILAGELCGLIAPWYPRARSLFETIRSILAPLIDRGEVRATEGILRIRAVNGGGLDCFSGDNYQGIYGGNFARIVVDEASRCPAGVWPAVLTTISATNGRARTAFNLELGSRNWAIKHLLRLQAMSAEERARLNEDYMVFPTGDGGLVDPSLIELLKSQMPRPLWEALYQAKVPAEDTSLFRNLDRIFSGVERTEPESEHSYIAGIDLARKRDFTVITILDSGTGAVVQSDRFHEISWTLQVERCARLYQQFRCTKAWTDCTGVGDPVAESLRAKGVIVESFVFTKQSRRTVLETLITACDAGEITIPGSERWTQYRFELESFECHLDGTEVRYGVPDALHDDCAISLALAVYGFKSGACSDYNWWITLMQNCLKQQGRLEQAERQIAEGQARVQKAVADGEAERQKVKGPFRGSEKLV